MGQVRCKGKVMAVLCNYLKYINYLRKTVLLSGQDVRKMKFVVHSKA